jgi:diguanylate cyclase (GGDEF)-like protein
VTLRTRLCLAFTIILLAPAILVGLAIAHLVLAGETTAVTRTAPAAVAGQIAAECGQLGVAARTLAVDASIRHETYAVTPAGTTGVWALCGAPATPGTHYSHLAARAALPGGWAYAVRPIDQSFLDRLSAASGVSVTLGEGPGEPLPLVLGPPRSSGDNPLPVALAAGITALVTSVALGSWLAALALRPLSHLLAVVDRAAGGDLTVRTRLSGRDEVGQLGARLDGLVSDVVEIAHQAVTDALTGLGNVRQLTDSLRHEIERATRFRRALGVLVLDLDHFKEVNDVHGHRAGDEVLTEFARRIRGVIREVDLAFRQGGEEFVILLPETDIAGSLTAARRINEAVRAGSVHTEQGPIAVTVSIGVAVYPRHGASGAETLAAADSALYAAKAAGRDTFAVASGGLPTSPVPRRAVAFSAQVVGGASVGTPHTQIRADG